MGEAPLLQKGPSPTKHSNLKKTTSSVLPAAGPAVKKPAWRHSADLRAAGNPRPTSPTPYGPCSAPAAGGAGRRAGPGPLPPQSPSPQRPARPGAKPQTRRHRHGAQGCLRVQVARPRVQQAARQTARQATGPMPRRPRRAGWQAKKYAYRPDGPGLEAIFVKSPDAPSAPQPGHCTGQARDSNTSTAQGRAVFFQAACARARARGQGLEASTGGWRRFVRPGCLPRGQMPRRAPGQMPRRARNRWPGRDHRPAPVLVAGLRLACGKVRRTAKKPCPVHRGCLGCLRCRAALPGGAGRADSHGRAGEAHGRNGAGLARCPQAALPRFRRGAAQRRQSLRA